MAASELAQCLDLLTRVAAGDVQPHQAQLDEAVVYVTAKAGTAEGAEEFLVGSNMERLEKLLESQVVQPLLCRQVAIRCILELVRNPATCSSPWKLEGPLMIVAAFDKSDQKVKADIINDLRRVTEELVTKGGMDMASCQAIVAALGSAGWFACLFRSLADLSRVVPKALSRQILKVGRLQLSAVVALDQAWVYGCSRTHLLLLGQHLIKHCVALVAEAMRPPDLAKACTVLLCRIVPLEQNNGGQIGQEVMKIKKLLAVGDTLVPVLLMYVEQAWGCVKSWFGDDAQDQATSRCAWTC
jgi:hypothetical protein